MAAIAAIAQRRGREARENGRTTFSSSDKLHTSLCSRSRGQPQNANEPGGVFLIVAVAHGEGSQIVSIKGVRRPAARDGNVSFVERQRNRSSHVFLRAGDEPIEGFTQGRK